MSAGATDGCGTKVPEYVTQELFMAHLLRTAILSAQVLRLGELLEKEVRARKDLELRVERLENGGEVH